MVVAARKRTLGEEHPGTLGSMHSLAISYSEDGRLQEALQLIETVVVARKWTLGGNIQKPFARCTILPTGMAMMVDGRRRSNCWKRWW